jgi:HEAT repeat protein
VSPVSPLAPPRSLSIAVLFLAASVGALRAGGAQAGKADPRLAEAAKELQGGTEPSVRKGAELCAAIDSVASIELLLGVLNAAQPHYRDIVWETLPNFRDTYARQRVATELAKNKSNDDVREWCAELLGLYGDRGFDDALLKATADKSDGVRQAAARSLGKLKSEGACARLARMAKDDDLYVRANAIEALATIKPAEYAAQFQTGLADPDGGVRCALLGALPAIYPELGEPRSVKAFADADWRVRMQAVDNLAGIRTKGSVDALIANCEDGRPVVAQRAIAALKQLTGMEWTRKPQWELWWKDNRETFAFPEGQADKPKRDEGGTTVSYNGIQIASDHVAFLIDTSPDMEKTLASQGKTKTEAAHAELDRVLGLLRGGLVFNVYTYATTIEAFQPKPVELGNKTRKGALDFVTKASNHGPKDIWKALRTVVDDPTLDTLYLLSSGEPDIGAYVHYNRVCAHLADLNRFHKVVVHTVVYTDSKWYRDQLEKIAETTGGECRAFE